MDDSYYDQFFLWETVQYREPGMVRWKKGVIIRVDRKDPVLTWAVSLKFFDIQKEDLNDLVEEVPRGIAWDWMRTSNIRKTQYLIGEEA